MHRPSKSSKLTLRLTGLLKSRLRVRSTINYKRDLAEETRSRIAFSVSSATRFFLRLRHNSSTSAIISCSSALTFPTPSTCPAIPLAFRNCLAASVYNSYSGRSVFRLASFILLCTLSGIAIIRSRTASPYISDNRLKNSAFRVGEGSDCTNFKYRALGQGQLFQLRKV